MATATTLQTVRFLSPHARFKLIRQSQGEILLRNGQVTKDPSQPSVTYWWDKGELTVQEGQDMLADRVDPETGEVTEQDALSWLRSHPEYGFRFHEVEPVAPDPSVLLSKVAVAAGAGDLEELKRLGDEEYQSWNRDELLAVIAEAMDKIKPAKEG